MFKMGTVKEVARSTLQPKGSYLPLKAFDKIVYDDGIVLGDNENVHGSLIGAASEYLTGVVLGESVEDCFKVPLIGAYNADAEMPGSYVAAEKMVTEIKGLDDCSVYNALSVASFDVWYRDYSYAISSPRYNEICPNEDTVRNVQTIVQRTVDLFKRFGGIKAHGFNFDPEGKTPDDHLKWIGRSRKSNFGGYSQKVYNGEGDYLTTDTMWDIKVLKSKITNKHTLQLLMYWVMGQHSGRELFKEVSRIGLFNPRTNTAYLLDMNMFSRDIIHAVEKDVIEYV